MADYLVKDVENKKWLWFKNTNSYIQLDKNVFAVFEKLQQTKSIDEVVIWCVKQFHLTAEEASKTVQEIHQLTSVQLLKKEKPAKENKLSQIKVPDSFYSSKNYRFNGFGFNFSYGDAKIETMLHPLFAHLETSNSNSSAYQLKLFFNNGKYVLNLENENIGSWNKNEEHLFKGQIYMALLNKAYSKTEKDWLGVLHASAIGNEQNSILFLGDSGNGKSTASAICLASGLSLIADDFVPIDNLGRALAFPAAISVKKQSLEFLSKRFPELQKAKEYELKAMNKTVRYLAPEVFENNSSKNVKALVFVKYTDEVDFELQELDKHKAFQYLVVDSWLSPEEENARFFMDWIADLPAYSLRYSDNEKMLVAVNGLLTHD